MDFSIAAVRRRFFIERALRRSGLGSPGDLEGLMTLPGRLSAARERLGMERVLGDVDVMLTGAHAAATYAPERTTEAVDYLATTSGYPDACDRLVAAGFARGGDLAFPGSRLGLYGSSWSRPEATVNLVSSAMPWVDAAFAAPRSLSASGDRIIPVALLVLVKLDASRSIDQGDIARVLGRLRSPGVEEIIDVVERFYAGDPAAPEDVRQYAELGRREYGIEEA